MASPRRDTYVLALLSVLNVLLALPSLRSGLLADNDFVCHYEYARIFAERSWHESRALFGFRPEHNLGTPFLLFNPPPLLYWAAAAFSGVGFSILASLKLILVTSFVSVPLLSYWFAKSVAPTAGLFPIATAIVMSLFSSELSGLDFFFRNGMANAAVAVPVFLFGLTCIRKALDSETASTISWIVAAALAFFALLILHIQTAYTLALVGVVQALIEPVRRWTRGLACVTTAVLLGAGLAAFWIVPSLSFSNISPSAFAWIRPYMATLEDWFLGRVFSSYVAGFSRRYVSESAVGIAVSALALLGLANAVRSRVRPLLAVGCAALLLLWLALGPPLAFILSGIPTYQRLLWYRFMTYAILCWQVLAGWGAVVLVRWLKQSTTIRTSLRIGIAGLAAACAVWAVITLVGRSASITTESDFPQARSDLARVADYLRRKPRPHGRIYSEFPKFGRGERVSVNYARHLLPAVLVGVDEVMSWSYENTLVSERLVRRGLLHDNPMAILGLQNRLNVQFITAQTRVFRETLARDPRWTRVVATPTIDLFESLDFQHRPVEDLVSGAAGAIQLTTLRGGGATLTVSRPGSSSGEQRLLVKYGYSQAWRAMEAGVTVLPSPEGLLELHVNSTQVGGEVHLVWDIEAQRRQGLAISAVAFLLSLLLVWRRRWCFRVLGRYMRPAPKFAAVAVVGGLVLLAYRAAIADNGSIQAGISQGMEVTPGAEEIVVGGTSDLSNGDANFLLKPGWGPPESLRGAAFRRFARARVAITVARGRDAMVTIEGKGAADGRDSETLLLTIRDQAGQPLCELTGLLGQAVVVPAACIAQAPISPEVLGTRLIVEMSAAIPLAVERIRVDGGMVYLEGESFVNDAGDDGEDAFYSFGESACATAHGMWMVFAPGSEGNRIRLRKRAKLPAPGRYALWVRVATESELLHFRAKLTAFVNGSGVGQTRCLDSLPNPSPQCPYSAKWIRMGTFEAGIEADIVIEAQSIQKLKSYADLDLVALEPLSEHRP